MDYDVLIAGAGVIGGMVARELSRYRLRVCLLEKENDVAAGASRANSGIIHGGFDPIPGTLKAELNRQGVELLYAAAGELHVPCRNNGSLVCAFRPEEVQTLHVLLARGEANRTPGLRLLSGDEARALEPNLSEEVQAALLSPGSGIICPYELTIAAVGNAMENGVTLLRNFEIVSVETGSGFTVTAADGRQVTGSWLLNCAGGYAGRIAELAGDGFFQILPRAGQYLLLDKAEGGRVSHTIFQTPTQAGKGILVTPTVDGNLLLGPTALPVDGPDSVEITPEGLDAVMRLASKSVPSLNFRQVITSFAGVRASERNGDFLIRPSEAVKNLVHVAAIDSPGLTCCVSIAKYAVEILRQQGAVLAEKPDWNGVWADAHRFRTLSDREKDAYIHAHPDYGKVVCRCEGISEGEIRDAIRREPRPLDLDGVKRRTRSGMGRCQGGFCSPYVMKLLSQELGIPMEAVTKCGSGSALLTGRR